MSRPVVLQLVGPQLVGDADPPALVPAQVDDDAGAGLGDHPHRRVQLRTAVAAPGREHVARSGTRCGPARAPASAAAATSPQTSARWVMSSPSAWNARQRNVPSSVGSRASATRWTTTSSATATLRRRRRSAHHQIQAHVGAEPRHGREAPAAEHVDRRRPRARGTARGRRRPRRRPGRGRRRSGRRGRRRGTRGRRSPRPRRGAGRRRGRRARRAPAPRSPDRSRHGCTFAPAGARPRTTRTGSRPGDVADGERRVVGADRAGADEHGLALGAQAVGVGAGLGAGDPLARAVGRRRAAVDGRGELEHDVGPAGAAVHEVRRQLLGHGLAPPRRP